MTRIDAHVRERIFFKSREKKSSPYTEARGCITHCRFHEIRRILFTVKVGSSEKWHFAIIKVEESSRVRRIAFLRTQIKRAFDFEQPRTRGVAVSRPAAIPVVSSLNSRIYPPQNPRQVLPGYVRDKSRRRICFVYK